MGISVNTRQAYSEIDEFLNIISAENRFFQSREG